MKHFNKQPLQVSQKVQQSPNSKIYSIFSGIQGAQGISIWYALLSQHSMLIYIIALSPFQLNKVFTFFSSHQRGIFFTFVVLERTFATYARQGFVRSYQVLSMIRTLRPDLAVDEQEFENVLFKYDPDNTGKYDMGAFNQIAIRYLIKASKQDHDDFSYKHLITSADFPETEA